jgi:hypothetical protein
LPQPKGEAGGAPALQFQLQHPSFVIRPSA